MLIYGEEGCRGEFLSMNIMIHPGDDHGCRCYKEKLPIHAEIIEQENKMLKEYDAHSDVISTNLYIAFSSKERIFFMKIGHCK